MTLQNPGWSKFQEMVKKANFGVNIKLRRATIFDALFIVLTFISIAPYLFRYTFNPLFAGERFFINGDEDLEIIRTPGHTLTDVSLIVRNVPSLGIVAFVGDLIMDETEATTQPAQEFVLQSVEQYNASRQTIACLSDYIMPGHGLMFKVNEAVMQQLAPNGCPAT